MTLTPGAALLLRVCPPATAAMGLRVAAASLAKTPSPCLPLPRGLCTNTNTNANTATPNAVDPATPPGAGPENEALLESLAGLGVDVTLARARQPGVFRRSVTNEVGVASFLQGKGASRAVVAGIISRFPRAITRSGEHLTQRWALWRSVFQTDGEIVSILDRSPESFFRSSDNENLQKNIEFLVSLGLSAKDLHRLLTTAPRTFSNSVELNQQMMELLEEVCVQLGGVEPERFAKAVITRNLYILIRSTKRVTANILFLRTSLRLGDAELLGFLQGAGAEVLDLSSEYLKRNFNNLQEKLVSLGCTKADLKKLLVSYPAVLYIGLATLSCKLDCLLGGGVSLQQVLAKPKVLEYSTSNITARLEALRRVRYDFSLHGINVLDSSRKRFDAKLERLALAQE